VEYHNELAEKLDDDSSKFHTGLSRAILESIWLLEIWEVEEAADPYEKVVKNISHESDLSQKRHEFMNKVKK
jgi:hypothetical protein